MIPHRICRGGGRCGLNDDDELSLPGRVYLAATQAQCIVLWFGWLLRREVVGRPHVAYLLLVSLSLVPHTGGVQCNEKNVAVLEGARTQVKQINSPLGTRRW
jgi:hypothetical protein